MTEGLYHLPVFYVRREHGTFEKVVSFLVFVDENGTGWETSDGEEFLGRVFGVGRASSLEKLLNDKKFYEAIQLLSEAIKTPGYQTDCHNHLIESVKRIENRISPLPEICPICGATCIFHRIKDLEGWEIQVECPNKDYAVVGLGVHRRISRIIGTARKIRFHLNEGSKSGTLVREKAIRWLNEALGNPYILRKEEKE